MPARSAPVCGTKLQPATDNRPKRREASSREATADEVRTDKKEGTMNHLKGYEKGTLAPLIKCVRCNNQARLLIENSLMAGLGAECNVCVEHAMEICINLGDSLGAQLLAEKMRSI